MADPQFTYSDRATTVVLKGTLLTEGKVQLCLMQTAPEIGSIATDQSRPAAVSAIQNLLVGGEGHAGAALSEMAPGPQPVLVLAPEFAFGSVDWTAIDAAVRESPRAIVLVAGFGATPGQVLLDWRSETGAEVITGRHFSWDQSGENGIGAVRPVNGGWCWIHQPGEHTHCIAFLKTVAEQNVEAVVLPTLQFGHTITHLRFDDVDLFPLICADLLQPIAQHPDSAQARIREVLEITPAHRPAMVLGSLLQHGYNVNWEIAVDSLLNQVMANRPGLVTLCNIAHDDPVPEEAQDRWRSLTGVYGKWDELTKGQVNLPVGRRLNVRGVVGAVVRRSEPIIATGVVDWGPYGPVDGKFIWHAEMHCACNAGGMVAPIVLPALPDGCELIRFIRRHPAETGWNPRLTVGLAELTAHIESAHNPPPHQLLTELLGGVAGTGVDPDLLHDTVIQPAAVTAIHSLALMATLDGMTWQANNHHCGQLRLGADRHILVWRDPRKTAGQMTKALGAWKLEPSHHPDLIVIGRAQLGELNEGPVVETRRDDVAVSPPPERDLGATGTLSPEPSDITTARTRRNVAVLSLARVEEIYADYDPTHGDGVHTAQLIADINALFPPAAA